MSDNPAISVIIPVYNTEKYLPRCLDSVLAQTFKDFELIAVNDGSPDNAAVTLAEYAAKDSRIKIITQTNQGQSVARNSGLKAALGQYIYFLDSDDFIHPQLLEICYHFITKHNADWITFKYFSLRGTRNHDKTSRKKYDNFDAVKYKTADNPLFLFKKNSTYKMTYFIWTRLYRKELLKNIEFIPANSREDDPFIIAICKRHPNTILLNEPLYYYCENTNSICNKMEDNLLPKHIKDYHQSIVYMWGQYKLSEQQDSDFLANEIITKKLRIQYKQIKKSSKAKRAELWKAFAEELSDLDNKGLIRFSLNPRKLFYWIRFKRLIKADKNNEQQKVLINPYG